MGGILEEIGMLGRGLMRGSKSGNVPRLLAREAESGLATRFVPPPAVAPAAPSGIRAYHGSPHSFDRFSMDKIGTGEGAQAYGHGLYFAENEGVAKGYRDRLAGEPKVNDETIFAEMPWMSKGAKGMARGALQTALSEGHTGDEAVRTAATRLTHMGDMQDAMHVRQPYYDAANAIQSLAGKKWSSDSGKMYEVNIKADPEHFLDWDKSLGEQPADIQEKFARFIAGQPEILREFGGSVETAMRELRPETFGSTHHGLGDVFGDAAPVAQGLKEQGIPGIKYLDAGSRAPRFDPWLDIYRAGDGPGVYITKEKGGGYFKGYDDAVEELKKRFPQSLNYAVWDDSIIEVVRKFGIAGALGAGLITQEMADQMRAQGLPDAVSHKTSPAGPSAMPNPQRFGG